MLNSRPLLPCSNASSDFGTLITNDFIIKKFDNFAPGDFNEDEISSRKKFKYSNSHVSMNFGEYL